MASIITDMLYGHLYGYLKTQDLSKCGHDFAITEEWCKTYLQGHADFDEIKKTLVGAGARCDCTILGMRNAIDPFRSLPLKDGVKMLAVTTDPAIMDEMAFVKDKEPTNNES